MTNSFKYLRYFKSMSRSSYPYVGYRATCKYNSASGVVSTTGFSNIAANDPNAHMAALQLGPVAVAVAASSSTF